MTDQSTPLHDLPDFIDVALVAVLDQVDAITDDTERLRVLNAILDGPFRRELEGERQKLAPLGQWMHSTYLDASQGNPEWREGSETRTIQASWDGEPRANLINSNTGKVDGYRRDLHIPMFDIDLPMRVVPSTNPGKGHLYIDKPMPWEDVSLLLSTLAAVGIVHRNYRAHSEERGSTTLRPAFVDKPLSGWSSDGLQIMPDAWLADPNVPYSVKVASLTAAGLDVSVLDSLGLD